MIGEFRKEKNMKPRTLVADDENGGITSLCFKVINSLVVLFVSAKHCIFTFDVSIKEKETKV